MNRLTFKRTGALYGVPWWTLSKDYLVLDEGLIIGRIICGRAGPKDKRWSWIILTYGPRSVNNLAMRQVSETRWQLFGRGGRVIFLYWGAYNRPTLVP